MMTMAEIHSFARKSSLITFLASARSIGCQQSSSLWIGIQFLDRPGLAAVLNLPDESTFVQARTVTVPRLLHQRLKYADRLPFFQMIAKNVGIRRATGQFVLATNIDILFSDELMQFIARQQLDPKKQYRVDRYDIESGLSQQATLEETLDYAWSHPIRAHRRYHPD